MGCYVDKESDRDLDGTIKQGKHYTPNICMAECAAGGYLYAGLQSHEEHGHQCLCGNSYGKHDEATNCYHVCTADTSKACGGDGSNSVYLAYRGMN